MLIWINSEAGGERRWSPWLACHNLTSAPRLPNYAAIMRRLLPLAEYGVLILTLLQSYSVCLLSLGGPKIHFYLALKSTESLVSSIKVIYSNRNFMFSCWYFFKRFSVFVSIDYSTRLLEPASAKTWTYPECWLQRKQVFALDNAEGPQREGVTLERGLDPLETDLSWYVPPAPSRWLSLFAFLRWC